MHACRHADSSRHGDLHTPIVRSSKTASSTMFSTLFSMSWRSDHTNYATEFHTALVGTILVPISPISNGCLFQHTTTCEFLSLMPPKHLLQNQICHRRGPKTPRPYGPPTVGRLGHSSLATPSERFGESSVLAGFLSQTDTDKR